MHQARKHTRTHRSAHKRALAHTPFNRQPRTHQLTCRGRAGTHSPTGMPWQNTSNSHHSPRAHRNDRVRRSHVPSHGTENAMGLVPSAATWYQHTSSSDGDAKCGRLHCHRLRCQPRARDGHSQQKQRPAHSHPNVIASIRANTRTHVRKHKAHTHACSGGRRNRTGVRHRHPDES
jgi:hypothetical protein